MIFVLGGKKMERNADEGGILRGGVKGDPASWRVVSLNVYYVNLTLILERKELRN